MTLDRYAVLGNPVAHSQSPFIHGEFARQTGQLLTYERVLCPLDGFEASVRAFAAGGGRGCNVTVPFKFDASGLAAVCTARATLAAAANVLRFDADGWAADNTDGVGLVRDIVHNAGITLKGKRVLLLGAGGAARGVVLPLLAEQPQQLIIANRSAARAVELVASFPASPSLLSAVSFADLSGHFDVIINATSASLTADMPEVPAALFGPQVFVYDMMYAAAPTVFMQWASQKRAAVRDGLGMLVEQAAESFFVWRGLRPDTGAVYSLLRAQLEGNA